MTAWVDGAFVGDAAAPHATQARPGPFETMGAERAEMPLWDLHLQRLGGAARQLGLPFVPDVRLRAAATEVLLHNGHTDHVLRLLLVPDGERVHTVLTSRARGPITRVRLLPTVVEPPAGFRGDLKLSPRPFYDAVRQQAQDGGADDGIVVASDGAVRETAAGNLWLRLDGVWTTPALDGLVLPGIARARLLAALRARGLPVAERRCDLGDLHRAEALAHSNAVYGPRPAVLVGAAPPTVAFVDTELVPLWRSAARD